MLPRPGQEFMIDSFLEHLHLIGYLGHWLSALGFDLMGKAGFLEALRIFSVFCQRGLHYRGQPRETHKRHLHDLYTAMVADLYTGFGLSVSASSSPTTSSSHLTICSRKMENSTLRIES